MSVVRLPFGIALLAVAFLALFPAAASAQLQDVQKAGWSGLRDGYALVVTMRGDAGSRTQRNFDTALNQIRNSMANMRPAIDAMGAKVGDDDRAYAAGLRENIKAAWSAVGDAHETCRRAVDAAKEDGGKLGEITDELDRLRAALEKYETACKAAFDNYKARWDEIQALMDRSEAEFKAAKAVVDALDEKDKALDAQEGALGTQIDRAMEESRRIDKAVDEMHPIKDAAEANLMKAWGGKDKALYDRYKADWVKVAEVNHKIIKARLANMAALEQLDDALYAKQQERVAVAEQSERAVTQLCALNPLAALVRHSLWDAEFPKATAFRWCPGQVVIRRFRAIFALSERIQEPWHYVWRRSWKTTHRMICVISAARTIAVSPMGREVLAT